MKICEIVSVSASYVLFPENTLSAKTFFTVSSLLLLMCVCKQ